MLESFVEETPSSGFSSFQSKKGKHEEEDLIGLRWKDIGKPPALRETCTRQMEPLSVGREQWFSM